MTSPAAAILLCAGLGTRLSPLTDVVPKPLLHFVDVPIVSFATRAITTLGIHRIGLNVHRQADLFRAWTREEAARIERTAATPPPKFLVEEEQDLRGTAGGLRGVWEAMGSPEGPIVVINGDVVADFPLEQLVKVHRRTSALATMVVLPAVAGESPVRLGPKGHFVVELPGPEEPWYAPDLESSDAVTFAGISVVDASLIDRLPRENGCVIRHGIGRAMAEGATIAAHRHDGFWADLGTPRRFAQATRLVLEQPSLLGDLWPHGAPDGSGCWIGDTTRIGRGAVVSPHAFVSSRAWVEPGAVIGSGTVIGGGCRVIEGARVEQSVLSHGAVAEGVVRQRVLVASRGVRWG
ncbi:MAG: NDP-sugar synthase [Deltaproteobacteria bacterium]|nr:MAG: NDP-sugar synthase [Deltaproteobacteria bacterium]